ncbi:hypothetical protein Pcinc_041132 [Petrolisthes cinctipes]|uniref:Uncharacterized protein n=1 Tax=Petrolisthes cinctipes TaxID=88211 RepID=A0AAE1BK62_PETCI|nr:hypothetical protein Pcinc_041132 [Petrolisthes cinctipes]
MPEPTPNSSLTFHSSYTEARPPDASDHYRPWMCSSRWDDDMLRSHSGDVPQSTAGIHSTAQEEDAPPPPVPSHCSRASTVALRGGQLAQVDLLLSKLDPPQVCVVPVNLNINYHSVPDACKVA